jgi:hypothetical protein
VYIDGNGQYLTKWSSSNFSLTTAAGAQVILISSSPSVADGRLIIYKGLCV